MDSTDPKPWEICLQQLRQLMRNEVVAHNRIRDRVLELQERYYDGEMGDGAVNWERWAMDRFAYNQRNLTRLTSPHPITLDNSQAKALRAAQTARLQAVKEDSRRAQAAWDAAQVAVHMDSGLVETLKAELAQAKQEIIQLQAALAHRNQAPRPRRGDVPAIIRRALAQPELAALSDRELARRFRISPQTVGNWRRRLDAVHMDSRPGNKSGSRLAVRERIDRLAANLPQDPRGGRAACRGPAAAPGPVAPSWVPVRRR